MTDEVFVTRPLPDPGVRLLEDAGLHAQVNPHDRPITTAELLEGVASASALLCMLTDRIDAELLDRAPGLRVIANYAVGFDNIDVAEARRRGIEVTTTPDVLTEATADLTWALLLGAARQLGAGERMVRSGQWHGWGPAQLLGQPVAGRVLGIVGMGAIGQAVARRAHGFGMPICYFNRRRLDPATEAALGARYVSLEELLETSDVVSLHAPRNPESHHLIDAAALARMKPTAILINTGRGTLIDEAALVDALRDGIIAAAGLDVFEREPELTPGLVELDNVLLAPHLGSASTDARGAMVRLCCENIIEVLAGRPAITPAPGPAITR
jgi:glyoxylate reductase